MHLEHVVGNGGRDSRQMMCLLHGELSVMRAHAISSPAWLCCKVYPAALLITPESCNVGLRCAAPAGPGATLSALNTVGSMAIDAHTDPALPSMRPHRAPALENGWVCAWAPFSWWLSVGPQLPVPAATHQQTTAMGLSD